MLTTAASSAAIQILNNALNLMKAVRERAQSSKDADLKGLILTLYDNVLSLKESVMLVTDENTELRRKIAQLEDAAKMRAPKLRQVGAVNYYFDGDNGPYCQPCYDRERKLTVLTPLQPWGGGAKRTCVLCNADFFEKPMDDEPAFGVISGPNPFG
jgi:hypothetical protein